MNFSTIKESPIKSPTAAFLYGKLAADAHALDKLDSSVIVVSVFGIKHTEPSAIDITEAIVNNLEAAESNEIRGMLQDRGMHGIIWRFTTPKMFMLQLSKIPTMGGHHELSLSLVTVRQDEELHAPVTMTRELVRFSSKSVTFFEKDIPSEIDYSSRLLDKMTKLHDEAVAKLEEKAEAAAPRPKIVKLEQTKVVTFSNEGSKLVLRNALTGAEMCSFEGEYFIENVIPRGNRVIYQEVELVVGQDSSTDIVAKIHKATMEPRPAEVQEPPKEPPPPPAEEPKEATPKGETYGGVTIKEVDGTVVREDYGSGVPGVATFISSPTGPVTQTPSELEPTPPAPEPAPAQPEPEIAFHAGDEVIIKSISEDTISITKADDPENSHELTDPNVNTLTVFGNYRCIDDVTNTFLDSYEQFSDLMGKFSLIKGETTVTVDVQKDDIPDESAADYPNGATVKLDVKVEAGKITVDHGRVNIEELPNIEVTKGTVEAKAPEPEPEQPKSETSEVTEQQGESATMETAAQPKIEVKSKSLEIVGESLMTMLTSILSENPGITEKDATELLKKEAEIDELIVVFDNDTWTITEAAAVPAQRTREEVKSIDIHNPQNQAAMLRGLFGVTDPAITHIEKFLKKHLTDENNAGFAVTGTFPTETTIVYTEKPYDLTYCIIKYLNGTYYRVFAAITNPALEDHGYIATKDIPGRWVKLGRDIQDTGMRRFNRMPNNGYRR